MTCPICGYTATRVSNNYWCPNDRVYLGSRLETELVTPQGVEPVYEELFTEKRPSKIFNYVVWGVLTVLYIIVIGLVAWSYLYGNFDDSSIFS